MLDNKYIALEKEAKWQNFWQEKGIYKFDKNSNKPIITVVIKQYFAYPLLLQLNFPNFLISLHLLAFKQIKKINNMVIIRKNVYK